jgi:hypothetical protein
LNNITEGVRERQDVNRTREAGHLDEIQGVVADTLELFRNGAVGFIDWLDLIVWLRESRVMVAERLCEWKLLLPWMSEVEIERFGDFAAKWRWLMPERAAEFLVAEDLQQLTQYDAMRVCARAVCVRSVAEQNSECCDIAMSSACNGGWIIDSALLRAVNEIGPVGRVLQCVGAQRDCREE